eukprot:5539456-Pyramimonas_sp.AAC.1
MDACSPPKIPPGFPPGPSCRRSGPRRPDRTCAPCTPRAWQAARAVDPRSSPSEGVKGRDEGRGGEGR